MSDSGSGPWLNGGRDREELTIVRHKKNWPSWDKRKNWPSWDKRKTGLCDTKGKLTFVRQKKNWPSLDKRKMTFVRQQKNLPSWDKRKTGHRETKEKLTFVRKKKKLPLWGNRKTDLREIKMKCCLLNKDKLTLVRQSETAIILCKRFEELIFVRWRQNDNYYTKTNRLLWDKRRTDICKTKTSWPWQEKKSQTYMWKIKETDHCKIKTWYLRDKDKLTFLKQKTKLPLWHKDKPSSLQDEKLTFVRRKRNWSFQ